MEKDIVHPEYYNDNCITPIDFIHANELPFDEGNVVKYIARHKDKNGANDVVKAIVYSCFILKNQYSYNAEDFDRVFDALMTKFSR